MEPAHPRTHPSMTQVISFELLSSPARDCVGRLASKPDSFVALGSPIGCFMSVSYEESLAARLRSFTEHNCNLYNVFHPNDPVAYRLEPLLASDSATSANHACHEAANGSDETTGIGGGENDVVKPPVFLDTCHGVDRVHVRIKKIGMELNRGKEKLNKDLQKTVEEAKKIGDKIQHNLSRNLGNLGSLFNQGEQQLPEEERSEGGEGGESSVAEKDESAALGSEEHPGKRIDFVLQESTIEVGQAQSYISAIAAHCIYFESPDVVSFLLRLQRRAG